MVFLRVSVASHYPTIYSLIQLYATLMGQLPWVNYNCLSTGCAKVTPNDTYNCYLGYNLIYVPMSKDVFLIPSGC